MHEDINSPMSQNSKPFIIMTRSSRISKSRPRRADTSSLAIATTNPRTALKMNSVYKNHWKMRLQKSWEIAIHTQGRRKDFWSSLAATGSHKLCTQFQIYLINVIESLKKWFSQNWTNWTGSYAYNTAINHYCCILGWSLVWSTCEETWELLYKI